jgi:hypothetical protein
MLPLAVGWTSLALGVLSFLFFCFSVLFSARRSAPKGAVVRGAEVDVPKLAEALAKLVDAFAKAGPTISALVASIVFVGFAVWIALRVLSLTHCPEPSAVQMLPTPVTTECVITGLPEPARRTSTPGSTDLFSSFDKEEIQEPRGCLNTILDRAVHAPPQLMFLVGRADRRQLRAQSMRIYGENLALAYQRAVSLKAYLIDRYKNTAANSPGAVGPELFAARIVTLAAGPQYLGLNVDQETLSKDRCVEIVAYWNTR